MSDKDSERHGKNDGALPNLTALAEAFGTAIGGAGRLTRDRARQLAERLLSQAGLDNVDLGEAASGASARINQLTEEILAARKANRALLQRTVAGELEKSLDRFGLARADEVSALRQEIAGLRSELNELSNRVAAETAAAAQQAPVGGPAAKTAAAKKAPAKKTAAKKTAAKKPAPAKKAPAKTAPAKKTATGPAE
jgi:polyhydroxyalkanoate synthesis regulator phasin